MANKNQKTIEAAPAEADALQQFAQLTEALAQTHARIPELLQAGRDISHELALAEVRGSDTAALRQQLAATEAERESAARRRAACINALLNLEPELRGMRLEAEAAQERAAGEIAREFGERWREACDRLNALRAEAAVLSRWLRSEIRTPMPDSKPAMPEPATAVPAHVVKVGETLDALDAALTRIGGVKQAKRFDADHYELSRLRGTPAEFRGIYAVAKPFDCMEDGLPFAPGSLVDASLIGAGMFHRLTLTRHVRPAELANAA